MRKLRAVTLNGLLLALIVAGCPGSARSQSTGRAAISPETQEVLDRISAGSLRGHLSFIASDLLEGRATPSQGLDTAALYIAAQFRRAGLEPAGDDGYFQTANWLTAQPDMSAFELKLRDDKQTIGVDPSRVTFNLDQALTIEHAKVFKVDFNDSAALAAFTADQISGKAILTEIPDFRRQPPERWREVYRAQNEFTNRMTSLKAAMILSIDRKGQRGSGPGQLRLIDPEIRRTQPSPLGVPVMTIHGDEQLIRLHDEAKPGDSTFELSIKGPAPVERPVKLRNVVGVLHGSDAALKESYVLVTAHYDHIGNRPDLEGDNIFNGANDDGSGTVSVIEIASALASMKERPKRSIVFMTFFGEERGLLGSRFYGRHPIFPIEKTVADINLEQVGRTDSTEGPQISNASMTGFDYSDVGTIFKAAGELTGITVYRHERNSDAYFDRSDNQALADEGVPAHTLCTAFNYPDYHRAGDHWDKIDYDNMAKVDRMVALALLMIANNAEPPKWNGANPKAARYVKAWKQRHPTAAPVEAK
jgi:hypothetical protein